VDENDELIDQSAEARAEYAARQSFPEMILDNLKMAGVQQAHKEGRIAFTALTPWPGELVAAEGRYLEGEGASAVERRAAIFIGPEFGTVTRPDLVAAAREAGDAGFDVLIACAFNYEPPRHGVQQARAHPRAQGAHERRPAYGRGPQEHRQGQPHRDIRGAGHHDPACRRRARAG